jgi:hypothetical protein
MISAKDDCQRRKNKTEVQGSLGPTANGSYQCHVIAGERRVLLDLPHRHRMPIPHNRKPVWVERVFSNVLCCPDEYRIIDVDGLVCERK